MNLGRKKIDWVSRFMSLLNRIEEEYSPKQPLKGFRIGMSIHLEAKTAYLAIILKKLGADVVVTGSNPLSTQDDVAEALKEYGLTVYAKRTSDESVYMANIRKVLETRPNLILDDGADLTVTAHTQMPEVLEGLKGVTEETTTGLRRLRALHKSGMLKVPVIAVNDAYTKYLFDNRYGTGQSTLESIMRNTNLSICGKTVVVCGYGWCGKGIAQRAKGLGARVIVTEVDPIKALEAVMEGFQVMPIKEAAKVGDIFITATGNKNVISVEEFLVMKNNAILANAGHFNVEIDIKALEELAVEKYEARPNVTGYVLENGNTLFLLAEGRLVNLAAADGHPVEIMDLSFAIQALSLIYLANNKLEVGVHPVPKEIDEWVARTKLDTLGVKIDHLTFEQKSYLESF
ncbi:adenosylhomocysteinase [Pseudothermotoga thermarum]|uniref:Adenosylhomocysteinase n=1 Tax=Pseudothermotoga thermarum DSM 5069 TaxID=688269 RepID=F7YX09_9THEM|nr:adenosylhomocysteinase [Pseudothermotoga thermarum]AEH50604.1 adenosylhomocysteinase [Pseudothermotoga thermarum DSM 5069]